MLSVTVVGAIGAGAWMAYSTPPLTVGSPAQEPVRQEKISRLDADRFCVPDAVCNRLKLKTAAVATAHACPFAPFQGCLTRDEIFLAVGSQVRLHENVVTAGVLLLREAADALPAVH